MIKRYNRLMAVADAAGYVLAAPDDPAPLNPELAPELQFESEFRNGHQLAARKASEVASRAVAKLAPSKSLTVVAPKQASSWLNTALTHLRPKGLAA